MNNEHTHPIKQPIADIVVVWDDYQNSVQGIRWTVWTDGVTRIEACQKAGEYAYIPYVRVWRGEVAVAEYCQHSLRQLRFAERAA